MKPTQHKILNEIKFFVNKTRNVGRTKLFKLLYFADFEHFKKTGYSITGFDYFSYPFGPVPEELYEAIKNDDIPEFLKGEIAIIEDENIDPLDKYKRFKVVLKNKKVDLDWFSPKELETLEQIAEIYEYASAADMTKISHWKGSPWDIVKEKEGFFKPIDYFLILDGNEELDRATISERFTLQKELMLDGRL